MRRGLLALLVLCGLAPSPPVSATLGPLYSWDVCGGTTFVFCSSIHYYKPRDALARLDVWNLGGLYGGDPFAVITRIGVDGLPLRPGNNYNYQNIGASGATGPYRRADRSFYGWWGEGMTGFTVGPTPWRTDGSPLGSGIASTCGVSEMPTDIFLWYSTTCGVPENVYVDRGDPPWVRLWFDDDWCTNPQACVPWTPPATADLYVRAVDVRTGDVSELWTAGPMANAYATPEPGTWMLLGTGLAGIAGVAWRRRRKQEGMDA